MRGIATSVIMNKKNNELNLHLDNKKKASSVKCFVSLYSSDFDSSMSGILVDGFYQDLKPSLPAGKGSNCFQKSHVALLLSFSFGK